jgi:hypothetical protein
MPRSDEQRSPHLLARRHPGWGCRRISAAMLERHGVTASKSAIANWVRDAGLAPANRRLRPCDWPRREAVAGTCGHPVSPPPVNEPDRLVLCFQCGWVDVRLDDRRALVSGAHVLELSRRPLPQPDTAPTAPESARASSTVRPWRSHVTCSTQSATARTRLSSRVSSCGVSAGPTRRSTRRSARAAVRGRAAASRGARRKRAATPNASGSHG